MTTFVKINRDPSNADVRLDTSFIQTKKPAQVNMEIYHYMKMICGVRQNNLIIIFIFIVVFITLHELYLACNNDMKKITSSMNSVHKVLKGERFLSNFFDPGFTGTCGVGLYTSQELTKLTRSPQDLLVV